MIASSSVHDRTVRLWETATGRLMRRLLVAEDMNFHALAFTPDAKQVLAGTKAAVLRWDAATGTQANRIPLYEAGKEDRQSLIQMHVTEDGRTLLASSQNLDSKALPLPGTYYSNGPCKLGIWRRVGGSASSNPSRQVGSATVACPLMAGFWSSLVARFLIRLLEKNC